MKRFVVMASVGLIAVLCVAVAAQGADAPVTAGNSGPAARPMGKLIVHEWGTFTGFAGSDGVHLPFNTIIGSDLPKFVMDRQKHAVRLNPKLELELFYQKGGGAAALQRMETPVIYFHADAPGEVDVRVDFPQGLLTEFYPPVRTMGPKFGATFGEYAPPEPTPSAAPGTGPQTRPAANDAGAASFLDWGRVRIVPHPTGDEGKLVPAVTNANHYSFARDADADLVQFTEPGGPRHEEKFLFYRGLGNFTLPVTLIARGGDRFELKNTSLSPIHSAFLVQIDIDGHKPARFARFANLAGDQELTLPPATTAPGDLAEAITRSLVADGLYEKEARAMVETWKASWLDEPGTRLLYIVPRPVTDAMLPLRILPAPDQTARVFVGRIDVLTPEQESRLRAMMLAADTTGNLSDEDARMLTGMGRFQAAALARMSKLGGDAGPQQVNRLRQALSRALASGK